MIHYNCFNGKFNIKIKKPQPIGCGFYCALNVYFKLLSFLVTTNAIGKLITKPKAMASNTYVDEAKLLTNKITISTPISTVAAMEKMALNNGIFMAISQFKKVWLWIKIYMLFIHLFYSFVKGFYKNSLNFLWFYPLVEFFVIKPTKFRPDTQTFKRFYAKIICF